jgi:glycosyltransferase involved in cell wall biosynthesis
VRSLHLPSSYLPDTVGGTETYVSQLVEELRERGHDAHVAWPTDTKPLPPQCHRLVLHKQVDRLAVYSKSLGSTPPSFQDLLEELRPDLVHFHAFTVGAGLDHAREATRQGIPYVVTLHTPTMACPRGTWLHCGTDPCDGVLEARRCSACVLTGRGWPAPAADLLSRSPLPATRVLGRLSPHLALPSLLQLSQEAFREFFNGAAHIVACAEFVAERLNANGIPSDKISVLRQALPGPTRERTLRVPRPGSGARLRLGFFGRITRVKGPDLLVKAAELLRTQGIAAQLEFAGPIAHGDEAWAQRELFHGRPWVQHCGTLHADALRTWLASLDVVAIPSRGFETGPLTLLEAWDSGTMAVGTDLGGIAEFMRSQGLTECLFALNRSDALAATVRRLLAWNGPPPRVVIPGMDQLTRATLELYARISASSQARLRSR